MLAWVLPVAAIAGIYETRRLWNAKGDVIRIEVAYRLWGGISLSPDGRFAVLTGVPKSGYDQAAPVVLRIHDAARRQVETLGLGDLLPAGAKLLSSSTALSQNARFIAFCATDGGSMTSQVWVLDRTNGIVKLISTTPDGRSADANCSAPAISADGAVIAFHSAARNLVPGIDGSFLQVCVRDRSAGRTTCIGGGGKGRGGASFGPSISADGRLVAFLSDSSSLVADDTNQCVDVFVYDRLSEQIDRASIGLDGIQGDGDCRDASISPCGRFVAFSSKAANLVNDDQNGTWDVFLHDRQTRHTRRISVACDGGQPDGGSLRPGVSADGRYVAFESDAENLVPGDGNGHRDVFLRDGAMGVTTLVSANGDGASGNGRSCWAIVSDDARTVAFLSAAPDLGGSDGDSDCWVYLWRRKENPDGRDPAIARGQDADPR